MLKNEHLITLICFFGFIVFLFSAQTAEQYYEFIPPDFDGVMYFYGFYKLINSADLSWFEGIKYLINNTVQWTQGIPVLFLKDILPRNYFLFIIGNFLAVTIAQISLFELGKKIQKDEFAALISSFVVWLPLCLYGVGYAQATLLDGRPEIILTMLKLAALSYLFIFLFTNSRRYALLSGIFWALASWSRFNAIGYVGSLPILLLLIFLYKIIFHTSKVDLRIQLLNLLYIFIPFLCSILLFFIIHGRAFYDYYFVANVGWGSGNPAFNPLSIFTSYYEVLGRLLCSQHYTFAENTISSNFPVKIANFASIILIVFMPFITWKRSKILSLCCFICTVELLVSLLGLIFVIKTVPGQDHIFIPLLSSLLILISIASISLVNIINSYLLRLNIKYYKQAIVLLFFSLYLVYSLSMTEKQTKPFDRSSSITLTTQLDELAIKIRNLHDLFLSANQSPYLSDPKKTFSSEDLFNLVSKESKLVSKESKISILDYLNLNRLPVTYMNVNVSKAHSGRFLLSLTKTKIDNNVLLTNTTILNASFTKQIEFLNLIFKNTAVIITPSNINLYNFSDPRFTIGNKDVLKQVFSNYKDQLVIIDEINIDSIPNLILVKRDIWDKLKNIDSSWQTKIFDLDNFLDNSNNS